MKIDKVISAKISNLTFVCTITIILLHLPLAGVGKHACLKPFEALAKIAVPLFFAISGFLLAKSISQDGWFRYIMKKRFHSLVIPYIAINSLYIPSLIVYHNLCHLGTWVGGGLAFNWYTVSRIYGLTYSFHPACGPIWYIRCLVMFLVLSPLFVFFIKKSRGVAIAFCVALFTIVSFFEPIVAHCGLSSIAYSFFSLRGLVFFVTGLSYGCWSKTVNQSKLRIIIVLTLAIVFAVITEFVFSNSATSLLSWMLFAYAAWLLVPSAKLPTWLTSSSFAIYTLHLLIYLTFNAVLKFCGLTSVFAESCYLWLVPLVLALTICYGFTYLIRNYAPPIAKIFFGGRC